jgi:hypothetical protein
MALNPRLSPDGQLLAFQAMDQGVTQVAVMKPDSGNWVTLTHRRDLGPVLQISWSSDGASIYYDRWSGVPNGVYRVPALGGDERLILENARAPEALADGSLLVSRLNSKRQGQVLRFWPDTGRVQDIPLEIGPTGNYESGFRAAPGAKQAIAFAAPIGEASPGVGLYRIDLASNAIRRLRPAAGDTAGIRAWTVTRDGTAILAAVSAGSAWRLVTFPIDVDASERPLFTLTNNAVWYLESGTNGIVYANAADTLTEVIRLLSDGGPSERIAGYRAPTARATAQILRLPDGRAVVDQESSGHVSLMTIERGKDAVRLANTPEETAAPMTLVGTREVAFLIGPLPRETIAVAEIASGRITHRITPGKGSIHSISSSPDGSMLYFGAGNSIWTVPSVGGGARLVCAGYSAVMEPSGKSLLVTRTDRSRTTMLHVSLGDASEQLIPPDASAALDTAKAGAISTGSFDAGGRLLTSISLSDSWFNPLGILNTVTGSIGRVPVEQFSDYDSAVWTPDGHILAMHRIPRSTIWRFQPEK